MYLAQDRYWSNATSNFQLRKHTVGKQKCNWLRTVTGSGPNQPATKLTRWQTTRFSTSAVQGKVDHIHQSASLQLQHALELFGVIV